MTHKTISVLYIGDDANISQNENWHIFQPADTMEALAQYITFMPDVTIIDADSPMSREVYDHLCSITHASPRDLEAMLVICQDSSEWNTPNKTVLWCISHTEGIAEIVDDLLKTREVDSLWENDALRMKIS